MNGLLDAAEAARPWVSTGFLGAIFVSVARFGKPVADYLLETRRIRAKEKVDDRQGFGDLIEVLTKQVGVLSEQNERLSKQMTELERQNANLRGEVRELHGVIDGMRREALQAGNSAARVVAAALPEGFVPPATQAALDRMKGVGG